MTMQYDVKSAHLGNSGQLLTGRARLKQLTYLGNGSQAGVLALFDSTTAPVSAVYARSGNTVTVTKTGHGLSTGATVGIAYSAATGVSATDGNYTITVVDANTFTITDPNSGSVSGGTSCFYVNTGATWLTTFDTLSGSTAGQQVLIPGEGLLFVNGVYAQMQYISMVTVFYG